MQYNGNFQILLLDDNQLILMFKFDPQQWNRFEAIETTFQNVYQQLQPKIDQISNLNIQIKKQTKSIVSRDILAIKLYIKYTDDILNQIYLIWK